jgi:hypothetical protein
MAQKKVLIVGAIMVAAGIGAPTTALLMSDGELPVPPRQPPAAQDVTTPAEPPVLPTVVGDPVEPADYTPRRAADPPDPARDPVKAPPPVQTPPPGPDTDPDTDPPAPPAQPAPNEPAPELQPTEETTPRVPPTFAPDNPDAADVDAPPTLPNPPDDHDPADE